MPDPKPFKVTNDPTPDSQYEPEPMFITNLGEANSAARVDADGDVVNAAGDKLPSTAEANAAWVADDLLAAIREPIPSRLMPTVSASSTSAITSSPVNVYPAVVNGGVQVDDWDGRTLPTENNFFFHGGLFETRNGGSADLEVHAEVLPGGSAQAACWTMTVEFVTSSVSELELIFWAPSSENVLLEIQGSPAGIHRLTTVAGNYSYLRLQFPVAYTWHIRVSMAFSRFRGVRLPTGGSISKPAYTSRRVGAIIGDSWVAGATHSTPVAVGTFRIDTYARDLLRAMGATDLVHAGIGGTGIVAAPASNNYITRVGAVLDRSPSFLVIHGSINDEGQSAATVQSALEALLDATDSISERYVTTVPMNGGTVNQGIRAAVEAHGDVHLIEMEGTFYGTGNVLGGTPNRNQFLLPDNAHPTLAGQQLLLRRAFRQIAPLLTA